MGKLNNSIGHKLAINLKLLTKMLITINKLHGIFIDHKPDLVLHKSIFFSINNYQNTNSIIYVT